MVPLKPLNLNFAQHERNVFLAAAEPGTTLEDVTAPGYWAHHVSRLRPGSIIEVLSEDNVLDCELRVLEVGPTFAKVRVLRNFVAEAVPKVERSVPDDIKVDYAGKVEKWRVVHKDTIVKTGHGSREEAEKFAEEYRAKFAA